MGIQSKVMMGTVSALALAILIVVAAASEGKRLDRQQRRQRALSIEVGANLYEENCRTCHGSRGEGVGQLGPALAEPKFFTERLTEVGWQDTLESYIIASSSHGRLMATRPMYAGDTTTAVMPPWLVRYGGALQDDQIRDIAVFVMNWEPTAMGKIQLTELVVPKTNLADPQTVARGQAVFLGNCAPCHTIANLNQADKAGPELTRIGTLALDRKAEMAAEDYIRESVLVPNAYIVEGFAPEKVGHRCGGLLSVRRLDEVVAFLLGQR